MTSIAAGPTSEARRACPLHDELPEIARLPFLPLLYGPTPLEEATGLEAHLGRSGVLVKRDDLASPLYGGNKVRRYEYLLGEARSRGARRLLTVGGIGSTQVTATAVLGGALGFGVTAVMFDQPMTTFAREAALGDAAAGAQLVWGGSLARTAATTARALARDRSAYFILPGASSPRANLGFVDAALELRAQVEAAGAPRPDAIVVPAGSGGTAAGLAVGLALAGWGSTEVVAVRITSRVACNDAWLRLLIEATSRSLARRSPTFARARRAGASAPRAWVFHGAAGAGYGEPTSAARAGAEALERVTGVPGEITYMGKAIAALRELGQSERYRNKTLLLWNTLSTPRPSTAGVDATSLAPALRARLAAPCVA